MYVMTCLKTKKQNALMSNTSANACRETTCTCYSFVTTKTPVIIHRGFVFDQTSSPTGHRRIIRVAQRSNLDVQWSETQRIRTNLIRARTSSLKDGLTRKSNINTLNLYHLQLLQEHVTFYEKRLSQIPYFRNRKTLSYPQRPAYRTYTNHAQT